MASAPASQPTFGSLRKDILQKNLAGVYLFHGEECYFIDELAKLFDNVMPPEEKDFNFYTLYAPQVEPQTIVETCARFPMMADRQIVVVKEAQSVQATYLNKLVPYLEHPSPTTVLVICSRGAACKSKELLGAVRKAGGVIFESKKLTERNIETAISGIVKELGLNIEAKSYEMLKDYIGLDASRIYNELSKLAMILGKGSMITPESIERNIGISKDFNNFELVDAIAQRNSLKAFRIAAYFERNPKTNPVVVTASTLFNYFSDLLIAHFTRDKSQTSLLNALGYKWPGQLIKITTGLKNYNAYQVIEIISAIRTLDTAAKGIGSRQNEYKLLNDLLFHILHAGGQITI